MNLESQVSLIIVISFRQICFFNLFIMYLVSGAGKTRKKYSKQDAAHKMLLELMKVAKSGQCFEQVSNQKLIACCKW